MGKAGDRGGHGEDMPTFADGCVGNGAQEEGGVLGTGSASVTKCSCSGAWGGVLSVLSRMLSLLQLVALAMARSNPLSGRKMLRWTGQVEEVEVAEELRYLGRTVLVHHCVFSQHCLPEGWEVWTARRNLSVVQQQGSVQAGWTSSQNGFFSLRPRCPESTSNEILSNQFFFLFFVFEFE